MKQFTVEEMYYAILAEQKSVFLEEFEAWITSLLQEESSTSYEQGYQDGQDAA